MSVGMIILGFVIGIIILLILVTIHEFAHFIIAKLAGAYVYEFAIGFGPKLFSWGKKETKYSLRLIPFGGYVYIASELADPPKGREDEVIPEHRKMENIKRWKKMLFIVAGAIMNFFIAVFIFTILFASLGHKPNDMTYWGATYSPQGVAYQAFQGTPNITEVNQEIVILDYWLGTDKTQIEQAALDYNNCLAQGNDNCVDSPGVTVSHLSKNNQIPDYTTTVYNFIDVLKKQYDKNPEHNDAIVFRIRTVNAHQQFSGPLLEPTITSAVAFDQTKGVYTVGIAAPNRIFTSTWQGYSYGWKETFTQSVSILKSFGLLFTGQWGQLSGPVGIAKTMSSILDNGAVPFFLYVAMLSANLFVLNLIPIPPLDGYKFLETAVEGTIISGKKINGRYKMWYYRKDEVKLAQAKIKYEEINPNWHLPNKTKLIINITGAVLFILLFIGITIKDIFF
ncbi:site-2 protease family protein [Spiroplasma chrysopicola]|uniref:Inner membrane zinc metalloprotease n=1 Tax=Spiroplasma chrysopicola DF-1 TaxID=1276227 RepID=R4UAG7_9MOLU|nr:site-2 protease family protein [Spiroplasma chrysopicola]AGM24909.1 inner membrane zinc metalloprotease [Spiroplasma chrysopicola DF-1]